MPVGHSPKDKNGENRSNPANPEPFSVPNAKGTGTKVNVDVDVNVESNVDVDVNVESNVDVDVNVESNVESMSMPMFRHSQRSRQGMHKGSAPKANSKPKL